MRIGVIDFAAETDLQSLLMEEGANVDVWFGDKLEYNNGDRYAHKRRFGKQFRSMCGRLDKMIDDADLLLVYGAMTDRNRADQLIQKIKKPAINLSDTLMFRLEDDRYFGRQIADRLIGTHSVEIYRFNRADAIIDFLDSRRTQRWVIKPNRSRAERRIKSRAGTTMVGKSTEDLIATMQYDPKMYLPTKNSEVIIEPYIEGYEVNVGGWFTGTQWVDDTLLIDQEYKGALEGDQGGILTGQLGTACTLHKLNELPDLIRPMANRLTLFLQINRYRGYCALNLKIHNGKIYLLEWTNRQGVPTEYESTFYVNSYLNLITDMAGLTKNKCKFKRGPVYLFSCLNNYGSDESRQVALGFEPTIEISGDLKNGFRLLSARYDEKGILRHEGFDRALIVCGKGKTYDKARKELLSEMSKVSAYNCYFRKDIGVNWRPLNEVCS